MEFTTVLISILTIHLMASISPGPDFVAVSQRTFLLGRKAGVMCGVGVCVGLLVHISYSVLGVATAIEYSDNLLTAIKILGGLYLSYLGYSIIRGSFVKQASAVQHSTSDSASISGSSFWRGFLVNVLNPKAAVYFISLFSALVSPSMEIDKLILVVALIVVVQMGWYLLFIFIVTLPRVKTRFEQYLYFIDRVLGSLLLLMGLYMVLF